MYTTSGVTSINKQRFLTELSKFLTFLSDEEKEQILLSFNRIFDSAENEEELLSSLVSPLKVTVELSRAYSKGGIENAKQKCVELSGIEIAEDNEDSEYVQESLFEEDNSVNTVEVKEPDIYDSIETAVEAAYQSSMNDAVINHASTTIPISDDPEDSDAFSDEEETVEPVSDSTVILDVKKVTAELPAIKVEATPEEPTELEDDSDVKPYVAPERSPIEDNKEISKTEIEVKDDFEFIDSEPKEFFEGSDPNKEEKIETKKQLKLFSLILFLIVFVPIGIAGILAILLVAAALVALMISAVGTGIFALNLTFSGMTMFADIVMTLGVALVCFAFGVLFLWSAVWLLIWAIGHLIKGILSLCRSWCYKEVVVE